MEEQPLPILPPRLDDSHKGTFGNALLFGGSRGMAGAIALAGMAAVRTGAGLVRLAVPECCLDTVAGFSPCPMLIPLPNDSRGRISQLTDELDSWLASSTCVALGPGLGRTEGTAELVFQCLQRLSASNPYCPVVIDADGLYALESSRSWFTQVKNPVILTPHPGEWKRLCGVSSEDRKAQCEAAVKYSASCGCTIVLKGHRSLITNGTCSSLNWTGTPAMATGGSGDVLTGIIAALVCQGLNCLDAARLGVYVHGLAGQLASKQLASHVVLPTELIQFLPAAFSQLL